ncbi:MAG TPA: alpha-L-arabinofuranosidase C-terminal domain-containing protein [Opitutaceae bacterium]
MEDMAAYTQDILDLIEWANGPVDSEWGRKRAEAGHPAPFNLKYVGVGNEEGFNDRFIPRFDYIRAVLKEKHPEITVIGTAGAGPDGHTFDEHWKHARATGVEIVDEHFYKDVEWFLNNLDRYDGYERNTTKVYIGEYACNTGSFQGNTFDTALCEAAFLTGLERNGDVVEMASYAPLLACDVTDQWVWKPDLIFFNNSEVKPSVNYQVQKLYGAHSGTEYWNTVVSAANQDPFVSQRIAASTVRDPQTGDIIIKLVNILPAPTTLDAVITNATHVASVATLQLLTAGSLADREATLTESTVPAGTRFPVELPAYSFAVLRLKTQ